MKQKDNSQKKVVLFPKLKEVLFDKGMESLEAKRFNEALEHFVHLNELYPETLSSQEVQVGMVVCLLEIGNLQEAKVKCKRLLNEDIGDYYDILQIYVTILIQLNEYEEVTAILEAVTQERKLPPEHAEHFFQILDFSRRMSEQSIGGNESQIDFNAKPERVVNELLRSTNVEHQLAILQDLKQLDVIKVVDGLKEALLKPNIHPVVKTMVLQLFVDKEIDAFLKVKKFEDSTTVNPKQLKSVFEQRFAVKVLTRLDDELGNENPTLFDVTRQIWEQYLFLIFPFEPKPLSVNLWAASLHKYGYDLHGIDISLEEICDRYNVEEKLVEKILLQIHDIEIGSFNL